RKAFDAFEAHHKTQKALCWQCRNISTGCAIDNETTKGGKEWKALDQNLTANHVQKNIDALSFSCAHDLLDPIRFSVVDEGVSSQRLCDSEFGCGTGCGDNLSCLHCSRKLHSKMSDASGSRMNQDTFPGAHLRRGRQKMICRLTCNGKRHKFIWRE